MQRSHGTAAWIALSLLLGAAGCHLTGGLPVDLPEGHGRVDRTYSASLGHSVRAAIDSLDELKVRPKHASVRAIDAVSDVGEPGWAAETNAEYFPDNQAFRDLFDKHKLSINGAEPTRFNPALVNYKGETEDGRSVVVIVRAQPPDASQTLVMTRVGHNGDEAWSRKLLDRITERLNGLPKMPVDPPVAK